MTASIKIVALGGTPMAGSSTEQALEVAAREAEAAGASVTIFRGDFLTSLPHYLTCPAQSVPAAQHFLECIRQADGLLLASPGWHGSIPGVLKNALDFLEETAGDARPYLDGLPVGLITTAYGWQATCSTLAALRTIVHALRGWPTPFGVAINSSQRVFASGHCTEPAVQAQLERVAQQVVCFARSQATAPENSPGLGVNRMTG